MAVVVLPLALMPWLPIALLHGQVAYDVSFPNAVHHEAVISLKVTGLPAGKSQFRMSRSSPGRYAVHEFAKNVYAVRAVDGRGRALTVTRPDPYQWDVAGHDGTVTLTYTLFADHGDGTYAQVDSTHAHLNMPATFMWVRGLEADSIRITFQPPANSRWKAATQLVPTAEPLTFTAPTFQYFMDSPTELSDHTLKSWTVTSAGRTDTIRLALHHTGTEAEAESYARMAADVVTQHIAVFGEAPKYDHGTYTFIADYLPWASGDGMEHRNSTILSSTGSLATNIGGLLGTLSHEFFHAWNVERIRPRGLEPFDFTRANMSDALWFAEGFTSYYGPLMIRRAGHVSLDNYAGQIGGGVNTVITSPARRFFSPMEMSMQAPFTDAATAIDPTNFGNTFISYYTWGAALGLGLDLTLRSRFDVTLDDVMRRMWTTYGKPEIPYTIDDLERTLGEVTRDSGFARDFFARYIRGRDVVDYAALLEHAGLLLRPRAAGKAYLGAVQLAYDSAGATIQAPSAIGSPLYVAGLDRRDRVIRLDGKPVRSNEEWQAVVQAHRPGDVIAAEFEQRGQKKTARITLVEDPRLELVTFEAAGRQLTDAQRVFREKWLGVGD